MTRAATIELGTGSEQFTPISNGDILPFEQGTQGLFHLFGSLLVTGIVPGDIADFSDPTNPIASISVVHQDQTIGGYQSLPRPFDVAPDGLLTLVGDIVLLDIHSLSEADGLDVMMTVEIVDYCGTHLSDYRTFSLLASSE
jgi:hypothetical protein